MQNIKSKFLPLGLFLEENIYRADVLKVQFNVSCTLKTAILPAAASSSTDGVSTVACGAPCRPVVLQQQQLVSELEQPREERGKQRASLWTNSELLGEFNGGYMNLSRNKQPDSSGRVCSWEAV